MTRNLDEAFVQRQVVSNGVLPALLVVAVVGKILCEESKIKLVTFQSFRFDFDFN